MIFKYNLKNSLIEKWNVSNIDSVRYLIISRLQTVDNAKNIWLIVIKLLLYATGS